MSCHLKLERLSQYWMIGMWVGVCVCLLVYTLYSDENWWKGQTQLGTGLFPANFVSPNLDATPEPGKPHLLLPVIYEVIYYSTR